MTFLFLPCAYGRDAETNPPVGPVRRTPGQVWWSGADGMLVDQTSVQPSAWYARLLASRTLARAAIVGTAVGIATVATMAMLASRVTVQATAQVQRVQEFSRVWNDLSTRISTADTTLRAYLATEGTNYRRDQLAALLQSTRSDI